MRLIPRRNPDLTLILTEIASLPQRNERSKVMPLAFGNQLEDQVRASF